MMLSQELRKVHWLVSTRRETIILHVMVSVGPSAQWRLPPSKIGGSQNGDSQIKTRTNTNGDRIEEN